jgi:hypothetical protein
MSKSKKSNDHNATDAEAARLTRITLRALLKSAPKPGTWVSLGTWTDAANLVATRNLDGVPATSVEVARILRELRFAERRTGQDWAVFAVTKAGLKSLERAGDLK